MYPNLSYFFHDIFGTEPDNAWALINTFGFFLALSFIAAGYVLYLEFKRKEAEGILHPSTVEKVIGRPSSIMDILSNALFGFIVGFKLLYIIQNFEETIQDAAGVILSGKGNVAAGIVGALLFGVWKWYEGSKNKLAKPEVKKFKIYPSERVPDIAIVAAISGIIGAKIFALFEGPQTFKLFLNDPLGQLLSGSGLAIYGGLILAFIVVYIYVKRKGIPPIHVMDAVAPALIIGYAVGRLGCQFSGDGDWGIVNEMAKPGWFIFPDWMWAYDYPRNVLESGVPIDGCVGRICNRLAKPVFPTPIYEVIFSLIIFAILWLLRKRIKIAGVIFFIYCILNGIERFYIEKIRVNDKLPFLGMELTQAEIISVLVFILGIVGCLVLWRRSKQASSE